jgi:hypothetical protein
VLRDEVVAIHGATEKSTTDTLEKLLSAQPVASRRASRDADKRTGPDEDTSDVARRKEFYRTLNKLNRAALCCSGGGIRSATFCLGVIQALAMYRPPTSAAAAMSSAAATDKQTAATPAAVTEKQTEAASASPPDGKPAGPTPSTSSPPLRPYEIAETADESLLSRFHYLSTVSGGGYIGSWLSAWHSRADFPSVWRNLTSRPEGPDIEPPELSWLRAYSNYLTARVGLGSADTWTGVAIFLRNLLLNWLVIVPAVAFVLVLLKLIASLAVWIARMDNAWWPHALVAVAGVAFLIVAQAFTTRHRPTMRGLDGSSPQDDKDNVDQTTFLRHYLIWGFLSAFCVTSFLTSHVGTHLTGGPSVWPPIIVGALFGLVIFAVGWIAGWPSRGTPKDFGLWALSGLVYGGLVGFGAHLFTWMSPYTGGQSIWLILLPVIFGVPWVLISQLFAEMVFVGLASYENHSDSDREWLGRAAGWVAVTAIVWGLTTFIVFAGAHALLMTHTALRPYIASAGGIAGIVAALIGKSTQTAAKPSKDKESYTELVYRIILSIAGPVFAAVLVVGISVALDLLLLDGSLVEGLAHHAWSLGYILFWLFIGAAITAAIAWVASRSVNINRFSLHALYRNRLIRSYLGASRQHRSPDLFTGFDEGDNPPMHTLWPSKPPSDAASTRPLFHVVNITLNVVQATRLAWQQRKAESFTASALHCGAAYKGFRPSSEYGGPAGLSLGTAMAISGAAASPNMGYNSSPSVTLLLALFNVRLGWWLGNPGPEGEKTYKHEGPATAIVPLFQESFGLTTDEKPYVYLSDGGHFENLGLYEMVRRRCRFILVIDAGCDPKFNFEDLGNAVRKIYIDLGIRIRFDRLSEIKNRPKKAAIPPRDPPDPNKEERRTIPYYALGTVDYGNADGSDADGKKSEDGYILYIKPAYHGTEGAGIRSYAEANKTFPHETTVDQFFSESQFESYRSLGLDIMNGILSGEETGADKRILWEALANLERKEEG